MRRLLLMLLVLLVAAPCSAQYGTRCWVKGGDGSKTHYVCGAPDTVPTIVAKTWFKAHCTTTNPAYEADAANARCNVDAEPIKAGETMAMPPGFWHRVKLGLEIGAAAGLFFLIIAGGGGGAFGG